MDTLILGLGNDFCSDDGIGFAIAERLRPLVAEHADVIISAKSGLALIDYLLGYHKAIIIDAICTAKYAPGSIIELNMNDLKEAQSPSPHYTGLPEIKKIADELKLDFPNQVKIYAIEAANIHEIGGKMSQQVIDAIDDVVGRTRALLDQWNGSLN